VDREAAGGGMNADWQIELAGFLLDRKEMGVADMLIALQAAHEDR